MMATKKGSTKKGNTKKSSGKKGAAKKTTKKLSGKKSVAKKGGTKAMALADSCTLTPMSTTILVAHCAPQAPDIGSTLTAAGLISDNERQAFGDCVFQGVLNAGCQINRGDIPTGANTTLRDVVFAILGAI